jgi:hypothetical protein
LNDDYYTSDLLSELYYRNIEGHAYPDYDVNKVAPKPFMYSVTDKKLAGGHIKNIKVLDDLRK